MVSEDEHDVVTVFDEDGIPVDDSEYNDEDYEGNSEDEFVDSAEDTAADEFVDSGSHEPVSDEEFAVEGETKEGL